MDKGIRQEAIRNFIATLPSRENTRQGNTVFRKTVMAHIMTEFGATLASAATHYNHAFIEAKKKPELAELLVGLGRPEDKKGGRKPKPKAEAGPHQPGRDALLVNMLAAVPPVAVISDAAAMVGLEGLQEDAPGVVLLSEGIKENTSEQITGTNPEEPAVEAVQKYSVCKASDKTVVCSDLTLDEANALIEKAAKAKKAKLELVA